MEEYLLIHYFIKEIMYRFSLFNKMEMINYRCIWSKYWRPPLSVLFQSHPLLLVTIFNHVMHPSITVPSKDDKWTF